MGSTLLFILFVLVLFPPKDSLSIKAVIVTVELFVLVMLVCIAYNLCTMY